jgi:hypothetical protein
MRHQALLFGKRAEKIFIDFDGIDRGNAQPRQFGNVLQDLPDQVAELRRARKVVAPRREIDAGQHHLPIAAFGELSDLRHDLARAD